MKKNRIEIWKKCIFFLILVICVLPVLAQDVNLRISDSGSNQLRIAVVAIEAEVYSPENEKLEYLLSNVMRYDLNFSPFFRSLDTLRFPTKTISEDSDIDYFRWAEIGTQFLVYGKFHEKKGELRIDIEVFSILDSRRIYQNDYKGDPRQARRMVHHIADDIVKLLTGEEGIAQTQIVFVSNRSGDKEIFIADYDGFGTRQITQHKSLSLAPDFSPVGDKILHTSYVAGNPDMYIYDVYKHSIQKVSYYPGLNIQGAFSPDGRKIALELTKDGNSEIYVMDARTGHLERLTHNWSIDTSPTFSPTGDEIAFTSDRSGTQQIYIMDVSGADVRRLTYNGRYNDLADWSPRGDKIVFSHQIGGNFQICVIDVTGDNMYVLTSRGSNESPSWSPDGYHVLFSSNRTGTSQLYVMNWDGTDVRRITNTRADNKTPVWSPRYRWNFK